jgi:exonuclease III
MNPSKIHSWNVHGLNSKTRQDYVRTLVYSSRVDIVCVQETKMASISVPCLALNFRFKWNYLCLGLAGGILVAWKHHLGPVVATKGGQFLCFSAVRSK